MNNDIKINVFIENEYEDFCEKIDLAKLTSDCESMVKYFLNNEKWVDESCIRDYECKLIYFDVVFLNNERIQEINCEYRQNDSPTDVITFAMFSDSPEEERFIFDGEINLGEILISLDKTKSQAQDNSHHQNTFMDELYFLFAHGILHLFGYDHTDEKTLQTMWDMQEEMIKGI